MKERGLWKWVHHLLCRWHVYEAIKKHCAPIFAHYPKGNQQSALLDFLDAFKNVVLAPHEEQMHALWREFSRAGRFPEDAVQYVRKEYYESQKAKQIMECYVYNCGNLHQTTTSRNEGAHAAFRSNRTVIPKLSDSYLRRREHNEQWIRRLRVKAAEARNRVPLDLQVFAELRELVGKISIFALTEINSQIIAAKREQAKGITRSLGDSCRCPTYHRYGLPCWHIVPTDGTAIALDIIGEFWLLKNWHQGCVQLSVY